MSEQGSPVTQDHHAYVAAHTRADDAFLLDLRRSALAANIPAIAISPAQASFLQVILRFGAAREVIEVGTLAGYSAISMARALPPEGRVRTIELSELHADFADEAIARSDVHGKIQVLRGDARKILPTLDAASADAAFVDADKGGYPFYLEECLRIVRSGGLIMFDNALAFGQLLDARPTDPDVPAVRKFNDLIAKDPRLDGVIVPLGDGCWVGVKR